MRRKDRRYPAHSERHCLLRHNLRPVQQLPLPRLPDVLKELDAQGMTLVSIHDRPAKTTLGQYVYVVECSGGGQDACEEIAEKCKDFTIRHLGSYPVLEIKNAQPLPANEETQDESE